MQSQLSLRPRTRNKVEAIRRLISLFFREVNVRIFYRFNIRASLIYINASDLPSSFFILKKLLKAQNRACGKTSLPSFSSFVTYCTALHSILVYCSISTLLHSIKNISLLTFDMFLIFFLFLCCDASV